MLGTSPKKIYAAKIAAKNQEATDALIDRRIRELCEVQQMMTPFSNAAVQPCSYDVHLGDKLQVEDVHGFRNVDFSQFDQDYPFWMKPGQFILGQTLEYVRLPDNVEAHLHLVSSRAREGMQHAVSGLVDCGWSGVLTLELKNNLQYGEIPIYPKLRIAQLTFFEYAEKAEKPYRGRYFGDRDVSCAKDGKDLLQL